MKSTLLKRIGLNMKSIPSKYTIKLGKLNQIEIESKINLHPLMETFCNELYVTDSITHNPIHLIKKFEDILNRYDKLDPISLNLMNYSLDLISKRP
jgi:hypothetical protein